MTQKSFNTEIWNDMSANFDRMAKSQGIYTLTAGFNQADTLNGFLPLD